ncbi:DSD1 family PLP-dependent enzyme [Phenylobacterium sp.]|uniref:DSD1 family PLP-dependent enzyme n=1 Tax=Phenylobacterium sp. TaxID=1871053 RepID=UPI002FC6C0BD
MTWTNPNISLIGAPGGRARLDTPALCVDLDALERNIAIMAARMKGRGVALRPHCKTHKSVTIARMQVAAGAIGICCTTLGEAEIMVAGGLPGVHITSPQVTPSKIERLVALAARAHLGLTVAVDDLSNLAVLAAAAAAAGIELGVLADYSAGHHRTGAATEDDVLSLARAAAEATALRFRGVQSYSGHIQHIAERAEQLERARVRLSILGRLVAALRAEGIEVPIVTGSGTGTHEIDAASGVFTEIQAGSYVFMDVDYHRAMAAGLNGPNFETALFVQTAVVSRNGAVIPGGYVTTDAGLKSFATEGPNPELMSGGPAGATYAFFGDEHGMLRFPQGAPVPALGDRVELMTPHCDPTVNLYDAYHVVRADTLVEVWPVDARGKR